jgi:hypothetical protein
MKKSIIIASLLVSTLVLGAQNAFAENKSDAKTEGTIAVQKPSTEDESVTDPVDPTDPDNPLTPDNPHPGTPGLITIDQAPDLDFGTIKLGTAQTVYAALQTGTDSTGATKEVPNYVQVTDKSGNYAGWELSVKRTEFTSGENNLAGSTMTFKNASMVTTTNNTNPAPATIVGQGDTGVKIPAETKTVLANAAATQGIGTWIYKMGADVTEGKKSVELDIPLAQYVEGNYVSNLTWTVTDAPNGSVTPAE